MNIAKRKTELEKLSKEQLIDDTINGELNRFVSGYADYDKDDNDLHGHGKRVPYIGWFWRNVDFVNGSIYIGDCGSFIGFMENNKWDYPERQLTDDEAAQVVKIVCDAHTIDRGGGLLSDIISNTEKELDKLWPLMQTFKLEKTGFWIHGMQGQVGHAATEEEAESMIKLLSDAAPGWRYWKVPV